MDIPDYIYGGLAGVWVAVTAFFGISWFRDLSARVRLLEEQTCKQEAKIAELKAERHKLRARLHKYGLEEESDPDWPEGTQ